MFRESEIEHEPHLPCEDPPFEDISDRRYPVKPRLSHDSATTQRMSADGLGNAFHFRHQPQGILAVNLANLRGGVAFLQQRARQVGPLVDAVESLGSASDAVEIAAQADRVHARDLRHVVDMLHHVGERGPSVASAHGGARLLHGAAQAIGIVGILLRKPIADGPPLSNGESPLLGLLASPEESAQWLLLPWVSVM